MGLGLILAVLVYAWALNVFNPDLYYRSLQEDEYLEWATVYAFLGAAVVAWVAAARRRRATGELPWFLVGVGLFCVFVAGEEISWGQRIFTYRPPVYFLENNFQQEMNLHNVVDTDLRKLALKGVILGYGVLLPFLAPVPPSRKLLERMGVDAPAVAIAPGFLLTFLIYEVYPWSFTGEVVELLLGFCFVFSLLGVAMRYSAPAGGSIIGLGPSSTVAAAWVVIATLGVGTAGLSRIAWRGQPGRSETAVAEADALGRDFLELRPRCSVHKRVYSFVEKYETTELLSGHFAALSARGLPEERAAFFLDPWNSPYWIRYKCSIEEGAIRTFVYSFGPDRKRDSSAWEIRGDDVGSMVVSNGSLPAEGSDS